MNEHWLRGLWHIFRLPTERMPHFWLFCEASTGWWMVWGGHSKTWEKSLKTLTGLLTGLGAGPWDRPKRRLGKWGDATQRPSQWGSLLFYEVVQRIILELISHHCLISFSLLSGFCDEKAIKAIAIWCNVNAWTAELIWSDLNVDFIAETVQKLVFPLKWFWVKYLRSLNHLNSQKIFISNGFPFFSPKRCT